MSRNASERQRVVIIGAGFGGLSAANGLANSNFNVTLIDQHNYHLFQPLLYQVATVGGGPTGVEMAGAIAELAKRVPLTYFRDGLRRSVGLTGATWKSSAFAEPLIRPPYYLASKIWITAA